MDMGSLQIALINNDAAAVRAELSEIDLRTESEMFRKAGAHFGFKTAEAYGREVLYLPILATVLGYSDPSGPRKLAERYSLEVYTLAGYGQSVRQLLLESFGLSKYTPNATFITWSSFLVAGMVATTREADAVKRYLLECERAARISVSEMARQKAIRDQKADSYQLVSAIAKVDRIKDPILRKAAIEQLPIDYPADARQGELPI